MHTINYRPDQKTLREFAEFGTFLLGLVALPLSLYQGHQASAVVFWVLAVALRVTAFLKIEWIRWPYVALSLATWPIGFLISHLALAVIYYLVFTPVALVFRFRGRDALKRKFDSQADSYWEAYNPDRGPARYLRQF